MNEERADHEFYYGTNDRLKLPNLEQLLLITAPNIELETQPYDPKKKIPLPDSRTAKDKEVDETIDREQKKIRWQLNADGKIESNARLIKWSDGSYQLAIGDLMFDVETTKLNDTILYSQCKDEIIISQKNIEEKATLHYASGEQAAGDTFEF